MIDPVWMRAIPNPPPSQDPGADLGLWWLAVIVLAGILIVDLAWRFLIRRRP